MFVDLVICKYELISFFRTEVDFITFKISPSKCPRRWSWEDTVEGQVKL